MTNKIVTIDGKTQAMLHLDRIMQSQEQGRTQFFPEAVFQELMHFPQNRRLRDDYLYQRSKIQPTSDGGKTPLVRASDTERVGIRNFNNGKILAGSYFIVTSIEIGHLLMADASESNPIQDGYSNKVTSVPAVLKDAHLKIEQKGQPTLFERPIRDLCIEEMPRGLVGEARALHLDHFFTLKPDHMVEVSLNWPEIGNPTDPGSHFFEWRLNGTALTVR